MRNQEPQKIGRVTITDEMVLEIPPFKGHWSLILCGSNESDLEDLKQYLIKQQNEEKTHT